MTQPHAAADPAILNLFGTTPDEVRRRLQAELEQLEAHLLTRQADWQVVQPQRDWTPAQEAEHVILISQSVMPLFALLPSDKPLPERPKVVGELRGGKRVAPPFSQPSAQGLSWDDLATPAGRWAEHRQQLQQAALGVQPTPGRTFWHPYYGELDALSWLQMVTGHIYSHRKALEKSASQATPVAGG